MNVDYFGQQQQNTSPLSVNTCALAAIPAHMLPEMGKQQQLYNMGPASDGMGQANFDVSMAEAGLSDFEPVARERCHTWPRQQAVERDLDQQIVQQQLGGLQQQDHSPGQQMYLIQEEQLDENGQYSSAEGLANISSDASDGYSPLYLSITPPAPLNHFGSEELLGPPSAAEGTPRAQSQGCSPVVPLRKPAPNQSHTPSRKNAWGNKSYAELIFEAITSTPDQRMTLAQIYDWMVRNVEYFRGKGDSNSSAGWKNSIRHNLSLHHRFKRIPNETSGKSSWWVIDPDGEEKTRRRAKTIDNSNKPLLDKKRKEAKSKSAKARARMASGGAVVETAGLTVADQPNGGMDFRQRSESNVSTLSVPGTLHHSPTFELEGATTTTTTDSLLWPPHSQCHTNAFNVNSEFQVPDDLLLRASDIKLEPDDRLTSPTSANQNLTGQQNGPITGQQQFSQGAVAPNGLYSFQLQQSTSKMETTMDKSPPLVVQSDIIEPEAASTSAFPPANQQPTISQQQQNLPFFGQQQPQQQQQRTFCHQPPPPPLPNYSSQFYFSQQHQQSQFLPPLDPSLPADLQNIKLEPLIACNIPDVLGHEFKAAGRLDFDTNMTEGL